MAASHNFLFVSDLHLSEGRNPKTGLLSRNEDFFNDIPFARMLAYHVNLRRKKDAGEHYHKPWKLVLNGDIFDFLQVISLPEQGETLNQVCGVETIQALRTNERQFGLGTRPPEIVWKLDKVAAGHPLFFQALAWFLAHEGHEIIWLKGNHDIELYWPAAQERICQLLVAAYDDWFSQAILPGRGEQDLQCHEGLLSQLNLEDVRRAVRFPPSFYYEPDLFYVEHGCQYEPANAFTDFENPTLPDRPDLIELPSGSLFVRYFFNKVEAIHPFADNIKPVSRYITWLIRNAPSALILFLVELLPRYLLAQWKAKSKQAKDILRQMQGRARTPQMDNQYAQEFWQEVLDIQAAVRKRQNRNSRMAAGATAVSILLGFGMVYALLLAARQFVFSNGLLTAGYLIASLGLAISASFLMRIPDKVLDSPYLLWAGHAIADLVKDRTDERGQVHYLIFGHTHRPGIEKLSSSDEAALWYVNTGAWIPIFREEERLLRADEQLTFMRLIPGKQGVLSEVPELLKWLPEAGEPALVRLFAGTHQA